MLETRMAMLHEETYNVLPCSLKSLCVEEIVKTIRKPLTNTDSICVEKYTARKDFMLHQLSSIVLPSNLVEILLEEFSKFDCLNGDVFSLFTSNADYKNTKTLKLNKFSTDMCDNDLLKFSSLQLKKLHLVPTPLNNWSVGKLSMSFQGCRESLTSLKLELYPGSSVESGNILDFVTQFPKLTSFHYDSPAKDNQAIFTNENWGKLSRACPKLETIFVDIDIKTDDKYEFDSSIFRGFMNLQRLSLRNIFESNTTLRSSHCISHFTMMDSLRHLDFSIDSSLKDKRRPFYIDDDGQVDLYRRTHADVLAGYVNLFLKMSYGKLQSIEYLDLSGIFYLNDSDLHSFIVNHSKLYFLGLCMVQSKLCTNDVTAKKYRHLKITGCILEDQIITSLLAYPDRVAYMREILKGLFQVSATWQTRKPLIIKIVLDVMDRFKEHEDIQWVATACVYQMCRDDENIKVELSNHIVNEIGKMATITMIQNIGNLHIIKNCLLISSSEVILYNTNYNRASTAWICLGSMTTYPEYIDKYVTQMAVTIIAVLAVEISPKERINMLQGRDMKLFLDIIQHRLDIKTIDGTLRWLLEAIWSFTDNSTQLIDLFIGYGGLKKYMKLLDVFADDLQIQTDVLGLLFNIAEMIIFDKALIMRIKKMISSDHIPVSYFACGVLANFSLRWNDNYNASVLTEDEKQDMLNEIQNAINRFGVQQQKIVNYKTFKPIYSLLESYHRAEIQHWAVWTVHHLCTLDTNNYRQLVNETCHDLLQEIRCRTSSAIVREQINGIYKALDISHLYTDNL